MHISITGRLGSGKSTIAKILKDEHGFEVYSTGAVHREIALEHKVSTLEMNQLMAQDLSFDHAIDDAVTRISIERKKETIVFDSRMAWKFAVNSFKIFVTVDPHVAAIRVIENRRDKVEEYTDVEDAKTKLIERGRLENERFTDIYDVDNFDYSNYNLVIDSTFSSPEELASIVYSKFVEYRDLHAKTLEIILSPFSLYPLTDVGVIEPEKIAAYCEGKEYLSRFASFIAIDGYHFIVDGHKRVLAAILNKEHFINVLSVDTDVYPAFSSIDNVYAKMRSLGISGLERFQEIGRFKYISYPTGYDSE